MRRLILCAFVALLSATLGPKLAGPQNRAAGTAFVYLPPEGFQERTEKGPGAEAAHLWVYEDETAPKRPMGLEKNAAAVRAVLHHSVKEMSVEESDLARLAQEMPKAFEDSCTWVHRRHELRMRSDGARVGLIEGDCQRDLDLGAIGLPPQKIRSRKLQLMFPDDDGTSILTASYPTDQAARWEPVFEATISKAQGVATRVPAPPAWKWLAWGAAGAVLGWLATALAVRREQKKGPSA